MTTLTDTNAYYANVICRHPHVDFIPNTLDPHKIVCRICKGYWHLWKSPPNEDGKTVGRWYFHNADGSNWHLPLGYVRANSEDQEWWFERKEEDVQKDVRIVETRMLKAKILKMQAELMILAFLETTKIKQQGL